MIDKLAARISRGLIAADAAAEDDREVLTFGVFYVLSDIQQLAILIAIALLFNILPAMASFTLFYGALRRYIGGAHASSHLACVICFSIVAFVGAMMGSYCSNAVCRPLAAVLAAAALGLVFIKAPIMHPHNPKSAKSLARYKRIGRYIITVEAALIWIAVAVLPDTLCGLALCAGGGSFTAACTLLFLASPKHMRKEVKSGEKLVE